MKKIISISVFVLIILGIFVFIYTKPSNKEIKIGIITPLTGGAAYWGESTSVGIRLAQQELASENIHIQYILEDGQLDSVVALNAAQKLVNVDKVNAIYSEFNPASIVVASFLKDKKVFHLYDSAAISPLQDGPYNFKTYLDYKDGCKDVSKYLKDKEGVKKVGVLKINIEFGDLCIEGIKEVFGAENVFVESYNPGITDYRSSINKINNQNVDAIFHTSFQPETLASLRQLQELGVDKLFVGLSETITPDSTREYGALIENDIFFGLPTVEDALIQKIDAANKGEKVADYNAAALGYVHMLQLGRAMNECRGSTQCVSDYMLNTEPVNSIGFKGFKNRVAEFDNRIVKFSAGKFMKVN
jgi:ABC-type branched-subunit amino acid transport system substrate-binding protein